jgi:O-antigen ligase
MGGPVGVASRAETISRGQEADMHREQPGHTTRRRAERKGYGAPFYLTLAYFALEFGRPQELVPALGALRPALLVLVCLAAVLMLSGRVHLQDMQTKLFVALLALMAAHVPIAANNYWAFMIARLMALAFVGYLGIVTFVDSIPKYRVVVCVWMGAILQVAVLAILHKGKGYGGFYGDENDACLAMNMMIPFAFFLGLGARRKRTMWMWFAAAGVLIVAVASTMSRGGFVGLIAVAFYCWLRAPRKLMSSAAAVMLALVMLASTPAGYWDEMNTITTDLDNPGSTGNDRIYSWKAGFRMFLDHPFVGVGPGNFNWNFQLYEPPGGLNDRMHGGRAAHSLFFTLIPELGLVGIGIFVMMLTANWRDWRRVAGLSRRTSSSRAGAAGLGEEQRTAYHLALALEGAMVGYLVSGIFVSVLYYPHFWLLMGMTVALRQVAERAFAEKSPERQARAVSLTARKVVAG